MLSYLRPAVAALTLLCAIPAQAALISSYDFTTDFSDTLGKGTALSGLGGTIQGGRYTFGSNQGLALTNALSNTTSYGIELGMSLDAFDGVYDKLIDFQNLSTDTGLYFQNGGLRFYDYQGIAGKVEAGKNVVVGLERNNASLRLFLNNQEVASIGDVKNLGISAANVLHFFKDDRGGGEAFAGSADFIRLHDDASTFGQKPVIDVAPVPLPAALPLLSAGLAVFGLVGVRRRRRV